MAGVWGLQEDTLAQEQSWAPKRKSPGRFAQAVFILRFESAFASRFWRLPRRSYEANLAMVPAKPVTPERLRSPLKNRHRSLLDVAQILFLGYITRAMLSSSRWKASSVLPNIPTRLTAVRASSGDTP